MMWRTEKCCTIHYILNDDANYYRVLHYSLQKQDPTIIVSIIVIFQLFLFDSIINVK